jgi:hypothetical protein
LVKKTSSMKGGKEQNIFLGQEKEFRAKRAIINDQITVQLFIKSTLYFHCNDI